MSRSDTIALPLPATAGEPGAPRVSTRFLRSELALVFRRRRNQALLAVLACVPVLIGVAVRLSASDADGGGPAFIDRITQNGLFLCFASLVVAMPFFLPLAVSVVAGESVAGEASTGTLRYLLTAPVSRGRLLMVKYAGIVAYALATALTVAVVGAAVGVALFPEGPVTLLSGATVPFADAVVRALGVAMYVAAMMAGVGAIGLFVSTLTEVPVGAMAATVVLTIVSGILDTISQVAAIHPYLPTHWWLQFGDLLRSPVPLDGLANGLLAQAAYIVVFLGAAWARFSARDVTG
jgi:ABC-2 type transport system permease protein